MSIVALAVVLALAAHLVFGAGGPLGAHVPPGLSAALTGPEAAPIVQRDSASCFKTAPAVAAVRSGGNDVLVRFVGGSRFMRIQYQPSEDAAIRWSYAHGSASNVYDNTNWFATPAHLSQGDFNALSGCLPVGRRRYLPRFSPRHGSASGTARPSAAR